MRSTHTRIDGRIHVSEGTNENAMRVLEYFASNYESESIGCIRSSFTLWDEFYLFDIGIANVPGHVTELVRAIEKSRAIYDQFWSTEGKRLEVVASYRYWLYAKEYTDPTGGRYDARAEVFRTVDDASFQMVTLAELSLSRARKAVKELAQYKSQVHNAYADRDIAQAGMNKYYHQSEKDREALIRAVEEIAAMRQMMTQVPNQRIRKTVPFTGIHDYTQSRIRMGRKK